MSYLPISSPYNQKTDFTGFNDLSMKKNMNEAEKQAFLKRLANPNTSTQEVIEYLNKETAGLFVAEGDTVRTVMQSIRDSQDQELFAAMRNNPSTNFDIYGRPVNANSNITNNLPGSNPMIQIERENYTWRPVPLSGETSWYIQGKEGKIPRGFFV